MLKIEIEILGMKGLVHIRCNEKCHCNYIKNCVYSTEMVSQCLNRDLKQIGRQRQGRLRIKMNFSL